MSNLRRYPSLGNPYFVTCVTKRRRPILLDNYSLLKVSCLRALRKYGIELQAFVVLPDHTHALINIGDYNLSRIMHTFKVSFAALFRGKHNLQSGEVWQKRFWDHIIRDREDLNRHMDYIHYNPVRHGFAIHPKKYEYSSIEVHNELYADDWGTKKEIEFSDNFGE